MPSTSAAAEVGATRRPATLSVSRRPTVSGPFCTTLAGSATANAASSTMRVPWPTVLSMATLPPIRWASRRQIARPRPLPP